MSAYALCVVRTVRKCNLVFKNLQFLCFTSGNYFGFGRPGGTRYAIRQPRQWGWTSHRVRDMPNQANTVRLRGRHLLDQEATTCLLVLLFVDEPKLNTTRLHRVLRNLCYHPQTRQWVIRSLLSILHRTNECKALEGGEGCSKPGSTGDKAKRKLSNESAGQAVKVTTSAPSFSEVKSSSMNQQPSWLSVSLDAALGCRANVFQIHRTGKRQHGSGGSSGASGAQVSIHPQASPVICRHVLDTLISLAKSFPCQFLPQNKAKEAVKCDNTPATGGSGTTDGNSNKEGENTRVKDSDSSRTSSTTASPAKAPNKSDSKDSNKDAVALIEFWDVLVRLDGATGNKKGKGIMRLHSSNSLESDSTTNNFEASPLGQLMSMLSYPVVRRSQLLTDRLLRLLGLVSVGLADLNAVSTANTGSTQSSLTTPAATSGKLLTICVIILKMLDVNSLKCSPNLRLQMGQTIVCIY